LKTFSTLSPLPGFLSWLRDESGDGGTPLLPGEEKKIRRSSGEADAGDWLLAHLETDTWYRDDAVQDLLRPVLLRLGARYLLEARRPGGGVLDPVGHFHLSNGARVERLNWLGDTSGRGLRQSAGLMVNYLYDTRRVEENHEAYRGKGRIVASSQMKALLKG
jgi:malonyl-CoA decarboxylase